MRLLSRLPQAGGDEIAKKRMGLRRLRFELGVELDRQKPGMIAAFHDLDDRAVRADPGRDQALILKPLAVSVVELVTVAVPFVDPVETIRSMGQAARAPACKATNPAASYRRARGPTLVLPSDR